MDADARRGHIDQRADVEVALEVILANDFESDVAQLCDSLLDVHVEDAGVGFPTAVVVFDAEEIELFLARAPIAANAFKHSCAVVEGVSKNVDVGFG